jgi:hypothetical protein
METFCYAIKNDELVKTVFSRKGAKNAKKRFIDISRLPLRALLAQLNLFCICLTGAVLREILTFYKTVKNGQTQLWLHWQP